MNKSAGLVSFLAVTGGTNTITIRSVGSKLNLSSYGAAVVKYLGTVSSIAEFLLCGALEYRPRRKKETRQPLSQTQGGNAPSPPIGHLLLLFWGGTLLGLHDRQQGTEKLAVLLSNLVEMAFVEGLPGLALHGAQMLLLEGLILLLQHPHLVLALLRCGCLP